MLKHGSEQLPQPHKVHKFLQSQQDLHNVASSLGKVIKASFENNACYHLITLIFAVTNELVQIRDQLQPNNSQAKY